MTHLLPNTVTVQQKVPLGYRRYTDQITEPIKIIHGHL
jgi:hypothetical protein